MLKDIFEIISFKGSQIQSIFSQWNGKNRCSLGQVTNEKMYTFELSMNYIVVLLQIVVLLYLWACLGFAGTYTDRQMYAYMKISLIIDSKTNKVNKQF